MQHARLAATRVQAAAAPPLAARRHLIAQLSGRRLRRCHCASPPHGSSGLQTQPQADHQQQQQQQQQQQRRRQERDALLPQQPTTAASFDELLAAYARDYSLPTEASLWDDEGRHFTTAAQIQAAYRPPRCADAIGLTAALSILRCWALVFRHALWECDLSAPLSLAHVVDVVATFASLEFLSTGLFITTHDSMHGAITPSNRLLNDALGATCASLYAWFSYERMFEKHWAHHNECGTPHEDPDFHTGNPAFIPWFAGFMAGYTTPAQVMKLMAITTALAVFGHAPLPNQLVFWAGSGLVSALRLFAFGTYLPHRPRQGAREVMVWAKTRSDWRQPALLSFLQCYCFGAAHWEHHRWPFCPWWDLPPARAVRYSELGSLDD